MRSVTKEEQQEVIISSPKKKVFINYFFALSLQASKSPTSLSASHLFSLVLSLLLEFINITDGYDITLAQLILGSQMTSYETFSFLCLIEWSQSFSLLSFVSLDILWCYLYIVLCY